MDWKKLVGCIALSQAAGALGSLATAPNITTWYAALNKPFFTPPNWLFGPAWLTLYTFMGIALYLVWTAKAKDKALAYKLFGGQLALNTAWSFLFFGLKSPLYGLVCIVPLWAAILATIIEFRKINKNAAYLLIPYIIWVTIATALNASVLLLN